VDLFGDDHVAVHRLVHGLETDLGEVREHAPPQGDHRCAPVNRLVAVRGEGHVLGQERGERVRVLGVESADEVADERVVLSDIGHGRDLQRIGWFAGVGEPFG
jgi:hypothetical protein